MCLFVSCFHPVYRPYYGPSSSSGSSRKVIETIQTLGKWSHKAWLVSSTILPLETAKCVGSPCCPVCDTVCVLLCFVRTTYKQKYSLYSDGHIRRTFVGQFLCACLSWTLFDEIWYPGTSVSPSRYYFTIAPYSYFIRLPSVLYILQKSSSVVQQQKNCKFVWTLCCFRRLHFRIS